MLTCFFPWKPNARPELLPEAGARHERTLEAVSSRPLFGMGKGLEYAPEFSLPHAGLGHMAAALGMPSHIIMLPSQPPAG